MEIESDVKLDFSDVLLVPKRSSLGSRSQVTTTVDFFDREVTPILAANMDGVGTFKMAEELSKFKILTALTKHYSIEDLLEFYDTKQSAAQYAIYSMGMNSEDMQKFISFNEACDESSITKPFAVCVDVANGYTTAFEDYCSEIAEDFPEYVLIAGNVVTPERVEQLYDCGVDVVKIGIGPGSVCTTRKMAGVGYPQLSAIMECSQIARDTGGCIISDGGCASPGDIAKAYAAGADLVMLGGMLAGHTEGGGEVVDNLGSQKFIKFYGMSSKIAQDIHNGGVAEYRASEGKEVLIPYRGDVEYTIREILGGVRSACTYIGAEDISQMHRKAKFVKVNRVLNTVFGN